MSAGETEIRIPARADHVKIVRLALAGLCARLGFSYDETEDLKLAVSEACNNALVHAPAGDSVRVVCRPTEEHLEIEVIDSGQGFVALPADTETKPEELTENGLGLFLMRTLMDEVTCEAAPEGGTVVRLKKRLPRCS